MTASSGIAARLAATVEMFWTVLRVVVLALAIVAGVGVLLMIGVTCLDVAMRAGGRTLHGAYDIVRVAGAVTIACALPYTSAVKGHVAIEYFFHKLGRLGRIVVDSICRTVVIVLFCAFSWQCVVYGNSLRRTGIVSLTLQIPLYWIAYVIAASCVVTMFVTLYNLTHPGREMIKP